MRGNDEERVGGTDSRQGHTSGRRRPEAEVASLGFARALLSGDPRAAAGWFAPDGMILTSDGTEVRGRPGIMAVLAQLTEAAPQLEIHLGRTHLTGEVALCTQFWRRRAKGAKGDFDSSTAARLLLRRAQRWEIAIADPWS